jgi:hypothetical protein
VPERWSTVQAVCEPAEDGFSVAMFRGDGNATLRVTGNVSVTDGNTVAPPAALGEPDERRYVLYVSTEPLDDREQPCADGGHVAYEAVVGLSHDGTEPFELTVHHDGEVVGGGRLSATNTGAGS